MSNDPKMILVIEEERQAAVLEIDRLRAQRDELLEALMSLCEADRDDLNNSASGVWSQAVAAIKKATE
jgi:hypothetical protein